MPVEVGLTLLALCAGGLALFGPAELTSQSRALAAAVIFAGCLPAVLYLGGRDRDSAVPFIGLVGMFYAVNFGLPMFTVSAQRKVEGLRMRVEDVTTRSLLFVLIGLLLMLLGRYLVSNVLGRRIPPVGLPNYLRATALRYIAWACVAAHLLAYITPAVRKLPSVPDLLEPLGYLGFGLLIVMLFSGTLSPVEARLWLPVTLGIDFLYRCTTGLVSNTMLMLLFLGVLTLRYRFWYGALVSGGTVGILLFLTPVKKEFREITWYNTKANDSVILRMITLADLVKQHYYDRASHPGDDEMFGRLCARISTISLFSRVVDLTPSVIPYWGGVTYRTLFTKPIPRFVWRNKPQELTGNEFGRRYGILDDTDYTTSWNLPWIVELYANFGLWGVFIGMFCFGCLFGILEKRWNCWSGNPVSLVYGWTLLVGLVYEESSFTLMAGRIVLLAPVFYFLLRQVRGELGNSGQRPQAGRGANALRGRLERPRPAICRTV